MKRTTVIPALLGAIVLSACGLAIGPPTGSYGSTPTSRPAPRHRPSAHEGMYDRERGVSPHAYYGYQEDQRRQEQDFQTLMKRLRSLHFDRERKEELQRASRILVLSGEQVKSILDLYHFDREKFEVLGILAPTIRSYRDALMVEQYFHFESDRKRVRQILSQYEPSYGAGYGGQGRRPSYGDYGYQYDERRQTEDYQALMNRLRSIPFQDDRKEELRRASRVLTLSGEQVRGILDLYPFKDDKFEVLGILAPTVRSYRDVLIIEQCFRFSDERERARRILSQYQSSNERGNSRQGNRRPPYGYHGRQIDPREQAENYQALMNRLRSIPFRDDRKEELRRASRVLILSGEQVKSILDLYSFKDEKFEVLGILAPTVRTYRDALTIEEYFHFSDEKRRVRDLLQNVQR